MILSLTLFCTNVPEFKVRYHKAFHLHQMLERFDRLNVSTIEFYDILRSINDHVKAIDNYYRNSDSITTDISYLNPGPTHMIEFRLNTYRSLLIAKQHYT